MKIIISPAKKMNIDLDTLAVKGLPVFIDEAEKLAKKLKTLSVSELTKIFKCNEKIAQLNFDRYQEMNLDKGTVANLTAAILTYEGLQYQYMAPQVMERESLDYLEDNLRILSGFYGILKPFDGVVSYRLEMQTKLPFKGMESLYKYWGRSIYDQLIKDDEKSARSRNFASNEHSHYIINLASKEYSKVIEPYITEDDLMVNIVFGELNDKGKIVTKGTFAKMARGEMVNYLAGINAKLPEEAKSFNRLGYSYSEAHSSEKEYVFLK